MRFKLFISVPATLAIISFVVCLVGILLWNLIVTNSKFTISVGVPNLVYLISLAVVLVFSFVLVRKSGR